MGTDCVTREEATYACGLNKRNTFRATVSRSSRHHKDHYRSRCSVLLDRICDEATKMISEQVYVRIDRRWSAKA